MNQVLNITASNNCSFGRCGVDELNCKKITSALLCSIAFTCIGLLNDTAHAQSAPPVFDWTGLYIAATFSGDSSDLSGRVYQPDTGFSAPDNFDNVVNGAFGAAVGYNIQMGKLILGFEGRWSGTTIKDKENLNLGSFRQQREISDTIMIGARIGAAFNRLHIYGTGGMATSGSRIITSKISITDGLETKVDDVDERIYGHYLGAGLEWAITKKMALGLEYDRAILNSNKADWLDDAGESTILENDDTTINTIVAKVTFLF